MVAFYKFSRYDLVSRSIQYPLEQFGIATYGVYLLHPIVNSYMGIVLRKLGVESSILQVTATVFLTAGIAIASFNLFERKLIKLGKKITPINSGSWGLRVKLGQPSPTYASKASARHRRRANS